MTQEFSQQQQVSAEGQPQTQQIGTVEENNPQQLTQTDVDSNTQLDNVGDVTSDVNTQPGTNTSEGNQTSNTEPPVSSNEEQLKAKLAEYELKEQEIINLKERLGLSQDVPTEAVELQNVEATFENQAMAEWTRLCNKYGVDTSQNGFDQSVVQLKEKDPKAYYEFEAQAERLSNTVVAKKQQIVAQRNMFGVRQALAPHKDLIQNSPAVAEIVNGYVQANLTNMQNPTAEINGLVDAIKSVYLEAYNVGQQVAKLEKAQTDTSGLNTSIAGVTGGGVGYNLQGEHIFTRAELRNMPDDVFIANQAKIENQMKLGLIK